MRRSFSFTSLVAAGVLSAAGSTARADFTQFFAFGEGPDTTRVGSTVLQNGRMELTSGEGQAGALWWNQKQQMDRGFTNTFRFRREWGPMLLDGDGLAVVIQNQGASALGGGGSGMGYTGLTQALVVEFDTFGFSGEFGVPHVSIQTMQGGVVTFLDSSSVANVVLADIGVSLDPDKSYEGTVQYLPPDGTDPGVLQVYINTQLVLSHNIDLETAGVLDVDGKAFVGFTAGTGLSDSTHAVETWAFSENVGDVCPFTYWHAAWNGAFWPPYGVFGGVHVVGKRPMTYRLYKNGVEITDDLGGRLEGLGEPEFVLNNFTSDDTGYYKIEFENECGSGDFQFFATPFEGECFDIDFNNDGVAPDITDIDDFLSVYGGGPCSTEPGVLCDPIDFNNDGVVPDVTDIEALIRVFGGGPCVE
jgi:hypothetical protein